MQQCEGFVFVDSLTHKHTAPHLSTSHFTASSPDSPFKGKSATECSALLKRVAEDTGAYILDTVFAIYDDRTLRDGSVLLVQTVDDELEEMRILPELVCGKLLQYMVCDADITEDREEAEEEEDCVFRVHEHFLDDDARPIMTSSRGSRWGG
jgi:hypothetical protein